MRAHGYATQLRMKLRPPRTHGGRRRGAGRKPQGPRACVSHHGRPTVRRANTAIHVTLRMLDHVWNLRSRRALRVVESALLGVGARDGFRVVHFSIQGNHVHLVCEADSNDALSTGLQALSIRLAKGLNRMMRRHGKVLADRFHAHVLRTPTEVRNAVAYVVGNHRSHAARGGWTAEHRADAADPYCSAGTEIRCTAAARGWLLASGGRASSFGGARRSPPAGG